jgi:hypothetical protein
VEVDDEASGRREIVKHLFKVGNMFRDGTDDDEGVISILEDRTGEVINQGVQEEPLAGGMGDHLLQDVNNNVEKEWGKGVALPQAAAALDPSSGHSVKEDRSLAREV